MGLTNLAFWWPAKLIKQALQNVLAALGLAFGFLLWDSYYESTKDKRNPIPLVEKGRVISITLKKWLKFVSAAQNGEIS